MRAPPAVLVHVLSNIDEVGEIRESADHFERLADRQDVEKRVELALHGRRIRGPRTTKADGRLPDRLDAIESRRARLRAQHVAEQAPKQTRVLLERQILVCTGVHPASI